MARDAVPGDAQRERTLLVALLLSAWAPLATGVAVVLSHSTTQLADFVRRTVELVAIAVAWAVFRHLRRRDPAPAERERLERVAARSVAVALTVSGAVMLMLALLRAGTFTPGGDVRLGLAVAVLGLLANGWFWRRYAAFGRAHASRLIDGQRRLYRAKSVVDGCVIAALATVAVAPSHPATRWVDLVGSLVVGVYLLWSAWRAAHGASDGGGTPASAAALGPARRG